MKKFHRLLTCSALASLLAMLCSAADAQGAAQDSLPDSPGATAAAVADQSSSSSQPRSSQTQTTQPQTSQAPDQHPQNPLTRPPRGTVLNPDESERVPPPKRLFGIVPNFRSVSTTIKLPPQTIKEKFIDTTEDSFDYSSLALATAIALEGYVANSTPEFGSGGVAFGRYMWHSATDQTIENYLVEFIIPVIAHEDTRFYTLGRGSFGTRARYSLGRAFITRSDSGKNTFNAGEILGAAAGAGISNFYYPRGERNVSNFATRYATNVGIDAASYFVKEFYPEISRGLRHRKQQTSAP